MDKRKSILQNKPMRYKGGRFDKTRYQQRLSSGSQAGDSDLYEVDTEALNRENWKKNYSKFNID